MRRRRFLFVGSVTRREDTRLPEYVMFEELRCGARAAWGDRKIYEWGVSRDDLAELSVSTPTSGRLGGMAQDGGRKKGRSVSWRNGSLQRKLGLDYGMLQYARTWREGTRQGEDSPKQCLLRRSSGLVGNLYTCN